MALDLATRRKAAHLLAAGRTREAAEIYRKALRLGAVITDPDNERALLALLAQP